MIVLKILFLLLLGFNFVMLVWSVLEFVFSNRGKGKLIAGFKSGTNNKDAILLIHGYGDTPQQFRYLCDKLNSEGFAAYVPELPGQNRKTISYLRGNYSPEYYIDYLGVYAEEIKERTGKDPIIVGFSMGGTLAVALGERGLASKVVLISPFFGLPKMNKFFKLLGQLLVYLIPVIPKTKKGNLNDPEGYKIYFPGSYLQSIAAYNKLQKLAGATAEKIDDLKIPALVLTSSGDETASFEITSNVFKEHPNTRFIEYSKSNHILLWDYDRENVMRKIIEFIKKPAAK